MKKLFTSVLLITLMLFCLMVGGCGKTEEPMDEPVVSETPTTEPVVEVDPGIEDIKEENLPEETVMNTEFGKIIRLGDNEIYPDMFEDLEIEYNGQIFQISLPKDMCVKFTWDFEGNVLTIANADDSRWLYFVYSVSLC